MKKFGKYNLIEKIGAGGMAEIYQAVYEGEKGFKKKCVIKKILSQVADEHEFIDMLTDEANIVSELTHSNIVQVDEFGEIDSEYFIKMEFINGKDLRKLQTRALQMKIPVPEPLSAYLIAEVCKGLHYAHEKKKGGKDLLIVHRDISPQNILISNKGEVKVTDFGIAKAASKVSMTTTGILKGKLTYMSPEQANGLNIDKQSDIFSTGIVLWELLTQKKLFHGENDMQKMKAVRSKTIPPPSKYNKKIDPLLDKIVQKALEREVLQRYPNAEKMESDLRIYLQTLNKPYTSIELSKLFLKLFPGFSDNPEDKTEFFTSENQEENKQESIKRPLNIINNKQNKILMDKDNQEEVKDEPHRFGIFLSKKSPIIAAVLACITAAVFFFINQQNENKRLNNKAQKEITIQSESIKPQGSKNIEKQIKKAEIVPEAKSKDIIEPLVNKPEIKQTEKESIKIKPLVKKRKISKKTYGYAYFNSKPWVEIWIKNKKIGTTPLVNVKLQTGKYKAVLLNPEYNLKKQIDIIIKKDKTTRINEVFENE